MAQLCGISVTWYTWIEQGREVSVSPSVWSRIAGVLQLARAERAYLFELADCADPQPPRDDAGGAPGPLRACVDAIRAPAYVLDRAWNLLAWNEPLRELFDDWPLRDPEPNLLRYIFLDPAARAGGGLGAARARGGRIPRRRRRAPGRARRAGAGGRAEPPESRVRPLVDAARGGRAGRGLREFQHPRSGQLAFQQITFRLATHPDLKLVMLLDGGERD